MKGGARSPRDARGFSLIEVLVAFAILSLSLGALMQIFARASLSTAVSAQYSRAAGLATSRLAAVGTAIPLESGAVSGEPEDGMAWELSMVPIEGGDQALAEIGIKLDTGLGFILPVTPYRVTATVLWRDGVNVRRLTLATLRLGEALE